MRGAAKRLDREHKQQAWLAWHVAALGRVKTMPDFKRMLGERQRPRRQTPEQIEAMGNILAAAWG